MKDQRIALFRSALSALVESLDATARLSRWKGDESAPGPLKESADRLGERLGAANRLASCRIDGAPQVVASLGGLSSAIRRLDAAYVEFRRHVAASPAETAEAAFVLDEELGGVKVEIERLT